MRPFSLPTDQSITLVELSTFNLLDGTIIDKMYESLQSCGRMHAK